jgi:hypothetical protein
MLSSPIAPHIPLTQHIPQTTYGLYGVLSAMFVYPSTLASLHIISWNVHGDLSLKLTSPEFCKFIFSYDICFLQETHLQLSQESTLAVPDDIVMYSVSCLYCDDLGQPGGGVLIFSFICLMYNVE